MKCTLVYLLKGKAGQLDDKLIKKIGIKFNERFIIDNPFPAHITLKGHFEVDDVREVENILKKFVKSHKKGKLKILGFSHFGNSVVFLRSVLSLKAREIQRDLIKELELSGIESFLFDKHFKPHAIVSYANSEKKYKKIQSYLQTLNSPKFDLMLDNIAIFVKPRKYWELYKEFKLK